MAICFELVVNFGEDVEAARAAALVNPPSWTLRAGPHRIPLHRPLLTTVGARTELAILPVAVSCGTPMDGSLPAFRVTAAELTELGQQLYELLARFSGYVTAIVGWEPEGFLDPAELKSEYMEELKAGGIPGLVLCDALHAEIDPDVDYEVFRPGYRWMPYRGERRGSHTVD